ncbi:hypothetical protein DsansV1_C15g0138801 [Dioscorea sansibarensis]
MLEKYQQNSGRRLWDAKHETLERRGYEPFESKEKIALEEAPQNRLNDAKDKQMDFLKMPKKNVTRGNNGL